MPRIPPLGEGAEIAAVWETITTLADNDVGTLLDLDTGVLSTTYDLYKIIYRVNNQTASNNTVRVRVNADNSSNYNSTEEGGGTDDILDVSGEFSWALTQMEPDLMSIGEYIIRGYAGDNPPTNPYPQAIGYGYGKHSTFTRNNILGGSLGVNINQVEQIRLFTAVNEATGIMRVLGMNF